MSRKYDIYISYSKANYEIGHNIVDKLQNQGYSCFDIFNDLKDGKFEEKTFEAINSSKCFLLLYSQQVETSQFIRREVEFALENGIEILPILLSEFKEVSWYKDRFTTTNSIRICDGLLSSEVIEQLLQSVSRILGESVIGNHSTADTLDSKTNFTPSSSNNTEYTDYSPNHTPDRKVYSKRGCVISRVIFFVIIGLGFFFSIWFVGSRPSSLKKVEKVYRYHTKRGYNNRDSLLCLKRTHKNHSCRECDDSTYAYVIAYDSTDYYPPYGESTEHEYAPPIATDTTNIQERESDVQSDTNTENFDNSQSFAKEHLLLFIIPIIIVLCGYIIYKYRNSQRKNVKITCNKSAVINIDGNPIAELEEHKVHLIHLSKGRYIVDFQLISDTSKHEAFPVNVSKVTEDLIVEGKFQSLLNEQNTIKVFIAGSTRLVAERDALRSVIGQMYNKYKEDNLLIEAYSFDDFPREFTEGGHQKLYDEFIRQKANWVVFITDGEMGEKTIWELENAINAYKSDKRPKILMYSKPGKAPTSLQMNSFRRLLLEENQYWIDYNSLDDIKTSFRDHLQWDLYNLMKSQYKKIS